MLDISISFWNLLNYTAVTKNPKDIAKEKESPTSIELKAKLEKELVVSRAHPSVPEEFRRVF